MGKSVFRTPFDVLINNFLTSGVDFNPVQGYKFGHPVDVYQTPASLVIEIACVGADKSNIQIKVQDQVLRVSYTKEPTSESDSREYLYKSISRREFDLGWKISDVYDLSKLTAKLEKGLLTISLPVAEIKEDSIQVIEIQ